MEVIWRLRFFAQTNKIISETIFVLSPSFLVLMTIVFSANGKGYRAEKKNRRQTGVHGIGGTGRQERRQKCLVPRRRFHHSIMGQLYQY